MKTFSKVKSEIKIDMVRSINKLRRSRRRSSIVGEDIVRSWRWSTKTRSITIARNHRMKSVCCCFNMMLLWCLKLYRFHLLPIRVMMLMMMKETTLFMLFRNIWLWWWWKRNNVVGGGVEVDGFWSSSSSFLFVSILVTTKSLRSVEFSVTILTLKNSWRLLWLWWSSGCSWWWWWWWWWSLLFHEELINGWRVCHVQRVFLILSLCSERKKQRVFSLSKQMQKKIK